MKFISTKTHGILDYTIGLLLILLPFLMQFEISNPESTVLFVLGAIMLMMALLTQYELGLIRLVPMPLHLTGDIIAGGLLTFSPWLFNFYERVYVPHLIIGILEIIAALMTYTIAGPTQRSI